jgi:hypothetical protein
LWEGIVPFWILDFGFWIGKQLKEAGFASQSVTFIIQSGIREQGTGGKSQGGGHWVPKDFGRKSGLRDALSEIMEGGIGLFIFWWGGHLACLDRNGQDARPTMDWLDWSFWIRKAQRLNA